jgi:hypothetical protein
VSSSYRDKLSEEINDRLQEQGHVTVAELAKAYDLPPEFLREVVENALGKVIQGQVDSQDSDVVFTNSFVARTRAVIRGAFSAITVYVYYIGDITVYVYYLSAITVYVYYLSAITVYVYYLGDRCQYHHFLTTGVY